MTMKCSVTPVSSPRRTELPSLRRCGTCRFPAQLKVYLENIYVTGIVTKYSEAGEPVGLCRASEFYYVTTSGGPFDGRFGYDYWKTIAQDCFGIPTVKLLEAENLNIVGADAEKIVDDAIKAYGLRKTNLYSKKAPCLGTELFYREKSVSAALLAFGQEVRHALEADGECGHVVQQRRGRRRQDTKHAEHDEREVEAHDETVVAVDAGHELLAERAQRDEPQTDLRTRW